MAYTDWRAPSFAPSIPALPSLSLSDDEQRLVNYLMSARSGSDYQNMVTTNSYFMGAQRIPNLKIAIPDELASQLRTLVGWAETAVNPYAERLHVDGFRLPGETDVNDDLAQLWTDNGMDSEFPIATIDALAMGRSWLLAGVNEDGSTRITVECPLTVSADYSLDKRAVKALISTYREDDRERFALMLPDRTIYAAQDEQKRWEVTNVDAHRLGVVTAVQMVDRARSDHRQGYSEITPALMSVIDSACRRLMGLEASSELYSLPRLMILGASAEDFQNADGAMRRAWDSYINKINVLERDEEGEVPSVHQLVAYDPSVFTKVVEMYASQAAGITKALPQDLGLYTDGNPISVDSFNAMDMQRNRRARLMQRTFAPKLAQLMQFGMALQNNGRVPDEFRRIAVDWADPAVENFATSADAVSKLIAVGSLPPRSDVTLKKLGFNPVERAQIAQDREQQDADDIVAALSGVAEKEPVRDGVAQQQAAIRASAVE